MKIELNGSGNLRLRWTYQGERYYLSLGLKDNLINRSKAQKLASIIQFDINAGKFDSSLEKYKQQEQPANERNFTCLQLFQKWIEFKSITVCPRSVEWYRGSCVHLISSSLGNKPAFQITRLDAISFVKYLFDLNQSWVTSRRRIESLCACWNWAIEVGILCENPWLGLRKMIKSQPPKQVEPFTQKEISAILKVYEQQYPQFFPFVKFLFLSGLRTSEAIGLRWTDLSPDFKILTVQSQLTRGVRKLPKNDKIRSFYLSDELVEFFKELAQTRNSDDLIFTWKGKFLNHSTLKDCWKKALAQAAVKYRKSYNTRATFISHSLQAGLSPVDVSALCGNSPRVIYSHYLGIVTTPKLPSLDF